MNIQTNTNSSFPSQVVSDAEKSKFRIWYSSSTRY